MNRLMQAQSIKRGYLTRNLIVNGNFSNGSTGWNIGGNVTILNDKANFINSNVWTDYIQQVILTLGIKYEITLELSNMSGRGIYVYFGEGSGQSPIAFYNTNGIKTIRAVALGTNLRIVCGQWAQATTVSLDNISVRRVL